MNIGIASAPEVDRFWPMIGLEMQRGCDKTGGATSSGELYQMCRAGDAFLFIGYENEVKMASVWRFETWPSGVVFRCMALCGKEMGTWIVPLYEFAMSQAAIGGTNRLIAQGRKGWDRALSRFLKVRVLWQTYEVR